MCVVFVLIQLLDFKKICKICEHFNSYVETNAAHIIISTLSWPIKSGSYMTENYPTNK
jgi:hypothetical protein